MANKEIEKLKELLLDSELLEELKSKIDNSINIFDILKISNAEIRHSNIIAWLLDPNGNHGLGDEFIKRLISYLAKCCASSDQAVELLMCNNYSFNVRREWRNIDLLITSSESKIVIAIENKIKSSEHSNQLSRYKETVMKHFPNYQHYFLFLTLEGYDSSEPEVWYSIGYESIIEWIETSLESSSLSSETKQILKQYHSILRREVMGQSEEVVELCNKIYEKHKEALDLIFENIGKENGGVYDFDKWGEEWVKNKHISMYEYNNKCFYFRTSALEKIFPAIKYDGTEKWTCYYTIAYIPFPNRIYIEFGSQRLNETTMKKFQKIKAVFNEKPLKDNWQWHRLKTWKLSEYNPDETEEFSEVSDSLKAELERIITQEIPEFEAEVHNILKSKL